MTFHDYLISKKINPEAFEKNDAVRFNFWHKEFVEVHPSAFTARHLFTINSIRRKYTLTEDQKKQEQPKSVVKPVIRPKLS